MPVIALTGATGFVGKTLVGHLLATQPEARLRLLVREPDRRPLPRAWTSDRIVVVPGSLDHDAALDTLLGDVDTVVHIAAAIAGNTLEDFERSNVVGTRRLLAALARQAPGARLVHVSSLAARHPDLSWYAATKRAAEELVRTRWPAHCIVRPPAVYGPEDPALADFWRMLARGWLLRLGPSGARFSMLHVDDLAALLGILTANTLEGGLIEPAGPQPSGGWSWPALADTAAAIRGRPIRTLAVPGCLLRITGTLAPFAGRLSGRPALLNPGKVRELQHLDWVCDNLGPRCDWHSRISLAQALPDLPGWRHV